MRRTEAEPDVAATFQGRVVLLVGTDDGHRRELIGQIRDLGPRTLIVAGRDCASSSHTDSPLHTISVDLTDRRAVRRLFAAHRPDLVLFSSGLDQTEAAVAIGVRRVLSESLRAGVESFLLIGRDGGAHGPRLADRIVRALSGLTQSRLLRVRIGEGVGVAEVATRLLRIAAKGRDGALVTLGGAGGMRVEAALNGAGDAEDLWRELDRIEGGVD